MIEGDVEILIEGVELDELEQKIDEETLEDHFTELVFNHLLEDMDVEFSGAAITVAW